VRAIEASLRAAEAGLLAGIEALKSCRIRNGWLVRDGRKFTAEDLRAAVNTKMMADGYIPAHTICAPGDQAVDPHEEGHGPIRAHTPVVMDIFPRSEKTGYFGTSRAPSCGGGELRPARAVRDRPRGRAARPPDARGRRAGHGRAQGDPGPLRAAGVQDRREGREDAGLLPRDRPRPGLQIHEAPSVGKRPYVLRAGHVVTVEPGLYYLGLGGVRIEDVALVGKSGSRCLTRVPKQLEV